jgi:hypothetical protein
MSSFLWLNKIIVFLHNRNCIPTFVLHPAHIYIYIYKYICKHTHTHTHNPPPPKHLILKNIVNKSIISWLHRIHWLCVAVLQTQHRCMPQGWELQCYRHIQLPRMSATCITGGGGVCQTHKVSRTALVHCPPLLHATQTVSSLLFNSAHRWH